MISAHFIFFIVIRAANRATRIASDNEPGWSTYTFLYQTRKHAIIG